MIASGLIFDTAVHTDPGSHSVNQDFADFRIWDEAAAWGVADGLGSKHRSEISARHAVEAGLRAFSERVAAGDGLSDLVEVGRSAHRGVVAGQVEFGLPDIRTTLAMLFTDGAAMRWLHAGDTRVYHWRDCMLRGRTTDHSVPELLVRSGDIAPSQVRGHPDRSRLLTALGQESEPTITVSDPVDIRPGDSFLICTDGWWEPVTEADMADDLGRSNSSADWLKRMANRIVRRRSRGQDHYTACGVRVVDPDAP